MDGEACTSPVAAGVDGEACTSPVAADVDVGVATSGGEAVALGGGDEVLVATAARREGSAVSSDGVAVVTGDEVVALSTGEVVALSTGDEVSLTTVGAREGPAASSDALLQPVRTSAAAAAHATARG
ncbi:MAG: hypothetical protein M3520_12970 [Actinomycetota bacterium]|nr:hypothetical protein [Actinomycetota bacterium]